MIEMQHNLVKEAKNELQ